MLRLRSPVARKDSPPQEEPISSTFSARWLRVLYGCVLVVAAALICINVAKPWGWTVDATTLGLVGIACAVPVIERLRKLKLPGGVEVELDTLQKTVKQLQRETAATGAEIAEERGEADEATETTSVVGAVAPLLPVDRVVWVDDNPEPNEAYASELRKRFEVEIATSTTQGVELVKKAPESTIVVTDAARVEGESMNVGAGRELLTRLRREDVDIPVIVFAGAGTIREYGSGFIEAGAQAVTSTFTELAEHVTTIARHRFRAAVAEVVVAAGGQPAGQGSTGWDIQTRVRVEARDWRRPPSASAFNKVQNRAKALLEAQAIDEMLVVVPVKGVADVRLEQAPDQLAVLTLAELRARLGATRGQRSSEPGLDIGR